MPAMDGWEWALWSGALYLAVVSLVRLMRQRRDVVLEELRQQAELESRRRRLQKKQENRRALRDQARKRAA